MTYIFLLDGQNNMPRLAGAEGLRLHEKVHIVLAMWDYSWMEHPMGFHHFMVI